MDRCRRRGTTDGTRWGGARRPWRRRLPTGAVVVVSLLALWLVPGPGPAQAQTVGGGLPAFPGAEGFGAVATGGRGGDVVIVTTLEPYGPGSFGEALDPAECRPRIVVFRVSGVIEGDFDLTCGDLTIAGQTAPGAGVTIRGRIDGYGADPGGNLVIRHIRVRSGPPEPDKAHFHDPIQLSNNPVVILDHVTASWGTDETIDLFEGSGDVTIQWSTVEESRVGGHPDGPDHNYGVIIGPGVQRVSIHHTLFAHHRSRSPALASGPAEVVNTVAYDIQDGFVHHNPADGEFHLVGNVYRRGPSAELVPMYFDDEDPGGAAYYLRDNLIDDPGVFEGVVDDIWSESYVGFEHAGGEQDAIGTPTDFAATYPGYVPVTVQPSGEVLEAVLAGAGAWPRDEVTARTVAEVRAGTGSWGAHEPDDLLAGLTVTAPPVDADADGMADDWELAHGLDPGDRDDHRTVMASGYTAIESYVNEQADLLVGLGSGAVDQATGQVAGQGVDPATGGAIDQTAGPAGATPDAAAPAASPGPGDVPAVDVPAVDVPAGAAPAVGGAAGTALGASGVPGGGGEDDVARAVALGALAVAAVAIGVASHALRSSRGPG